MSCIGLSVHPAAHPLKLWLNFFQGYRESFIFFCLRHCVTNTYSFWYFLIFHIHCVPGVKRPRREAGHSSPSNARSRKRGSLYPLPRTPSWHSVYLVKYKDNFTFTLPLAYRHDSCAEFWGGINSIVIAHKSRLRFTKKFFENCDIFMNISHIIF
jgi:hypothetical protein